MGRRNFAVLEGIDIVLSAAMPEGAVFCTRVPEGIRIRMWCLLDEDDIVRALIHEFTEISIGERLRSLGFLRKLQKTVQFDNMSGSIPHILTQQSLAYGISTRSLRVRIRR